MCLFFRKVRQKSFTFTINVAFLRYLFVIFLKQTKKNFIVSNKKCHVYPIVQQLWSNVYQLVNMFVIINCFFFFLQSSYIPSLNGWVKFLFFMILSFLYAFAAIHIQPPNKNLFFRLIFLFSFIDFKRIFFSSDIDSKRGTSPWLEMSWI